MNNDQFELLLHTLNRIATALEANQPDQKCPDVQVELKEFPNFDWESIGCKVVNRDHDGVSVVSWNNRLYRRRSPNNKYGPVVFFSRCIGKDESGNIYERLIKFSEIKADDIEPISLKAQQYLRN